MTFWLTMLSLAATMICVFTDHDIAAIPFAVASVVFMCAYAWVRTGEKLKQEAE